MVLFSNHNQKEDKLYAKCVTDVQLYVEGLCHGNLSEKEAVRLSEIFTSTLSAKPLPDELKYHDRVICLPPGAMLLRSMPVKNELEVNSVVEVSLSLSYLIA